MYILALNLSDTAKLSKSDNFERL